MVTAHQCPRCDELVWVMNLGFLCACGSSRPPVFRRDGVDQRVAQGAVVGEGVMAQAGLAGEGEGLGGGGAAGVGRIAADGDSPGTREGESGDGWEVSRGGEA